MQAGSVVAGRFRIIHQAGSGGFAAVFKAFDEVASETVALKVLIGTCADFLRFEREAEILASIRHPYVVGYTAHGRTEADAPYLAMEWLEGIDLEQRLDRGGALPLEEALGLSMRVAQGLAAAHARGIVHRDVKPSNIFLVGGRTDDIKILDFGIARTALSNAKLTATGMVLGTPAYMSPSQAAGESHLGSETDVFSLGAVLFECLTGERLYPGSGGHAVLGKILVGRLPDWPSYRDKIPRLVELLLTRMLAYEPSARLSDGEVVSLAIASILGDRTSTPPALRASQPVSVRERSASSRILVAVSEDSRLAHELTIELTREGAEVARKHGGAIEATFVRPAPAVAADRAARAALTLGARYEELAISISTATATSPAPAIEPVVAGRIELDATTAGYVAATFELESDEAGRSFLVGARSTRRTGAGPMVGRSQELSRLEGLVQSAIDEEAARLGIVTADAGTGKSRLLRELRSRLARMPGVVVVSAFADAPRKASPFDVVRQIVADLMPLPQSADLRRLIGALVERGLTPEVARWAVDLARGHREDEDTTARAAMSDPIAVLDSYRTAWLALLRSTVLAAPLVLLVEDLHWVDPISVQFLHEVLVELEEQPFAVVATSRGAEGAEAVRVLEARHPEIIELKPLRPKPALELARALAPSASEARVRDVVERAHGNPLRIEQLLQLEEGEDGADSLRGDIERRLSRLGADVRRLLRAASVFGARFSSDGLAVLLTDSAAAVEVVAMLDAAEAAGFVRNAGRTGGWSFAHSLYRDVAYASLPDADRAWAHGAVAEWLERTAHFDAPLIAWHYEQARESSRALKWYETAARIALQGNDLTRAQELIDRALACDPLPALRADLLVHRAEAAMMRSAIDEAIAASIDALRHCAPGTPTWVRAAAAGITALGQKGKNAEVAQVLDQLKAHPPQAEAVSAWIIAVCRAVNQLRDREVEALELAEKLACTDPQAAAWITRIKGTIALRLDHDLDGFMACSRDAAALHQAAGDARGACLCRVYRISGYAFLGDFDAALAEVEVAKALAARTGATYLKKWADYAKGKALALSAEPQVARAHLEATRKELQGSLRIVAGTHLYSAIAAFRAGDAKWAAEEAAEARRVYDTPVIGIPADAASARALAMMGRGQEAIELARRASRALAEIGNLEEHEALVFLAPIEAALAIEAKDEAKAAATAAVARLLHWAPKTGGPARREVYFRAIEVHDRTLILAHRLGVDLGAV